MISNDSFLRTIVNYLVWRFVFKSMPLVSERFQKMWTHFKMSVPNLTDERIYLARFICIFISTSIKITSYFKSNSFFGTILMG